MKKIIILLLVVIPSSVFGFDLDDFKIKYGLPSQQDIIVKSEYIICYNKKAKVPRWVATVLTKEEVEMAEGGSRPSYWYQENDILRPFRASNSDYSKSGYDKGHLFPSASAVNKKETFFLSNAAPQVPNFNRGIWKSLESKVRRWAIERQEIVVFSGVYFDRGRPKTIGENKVYIPQNWYKVIYDPEEYSVIAYTFKNKVYDYKDFSRNQTTVDYIERRTGLNFLKPLPNRIENKIEALKIEWE